MHAGVIYLVENCYHDLYLSTFFSDCVCLFWSSEDIPITLVMVPPLLGIYQIGQLIINAISSVFQGLNNLMSL